MLIGSTVTVTSTPVVLADASAFDGPFEVKLRTSSQVFVGDSSVSPSSGYLVDVNTPGDFTIRLNGEDSLYGTVSGTVAVHVLAYSV